MPAKQTSAAAKPSYLRVAVAAPLSQLFDYRAPADAPGEALVPGMRLRVPFGRQSRFGVLIEPAATTSVSGKRLRTAELLDDAPLIAGPVLELARWAAEYYAHPLGEVMATILPPTVRQARRLVEPHRHIWRGNGSAGEQPDLTRAPLQRALLERILAAPAGLTAAELADAGGSWREALKALTGKGIVERVEQPLLEATPGAGNEAPPALNAAQAEAVTAVTAKLGQFTPFCLRGITGSGKTEVYLRVVEALLARGGQALILVPEISLTPQLIARVRARFAVPVAALHSGLSDRERYRGWLAAAQGVARIVLGTRSAVFTPLPQLGLIVVDEEHDGSFKQQDGFRYHARDLAIVRAKREQVPVVLGSATPSLETLDNVARGRYVALSLPQRAGEASTPALKLVDVRRRPLVEGVSQPLLEALGEHLDRGQQALVFLNRRGFAPTVLCDACGWTAECKRCDARLTVHLKHQRLQCHHCAAAAPLPTACPECGAEPLALIGEGTERLESVLEQRFPEVPVIRVDRDSTRRRGELQRRLAHADEGRPCILVGTQMLAKGHHFPGVTLVGVVGADRGLYGVDFRAPEQLAQLIIQVAGRAGRGSVAGEVLIQTRNPEHPLLQLLITEGYDAFARAALAEREATALPPFSRLAIVRAEAVQPGQALDFLDRVRDLARSLAAGSDVSVLGPAPAPMERLAGRYRAQLLLQSSQRRGLHALCTRLRQQLETDAKSRAVRWSLDVDAMDML